MNITCPYCHRPCNDRLRRCPHCNGALPRKWTRAQACCPRCHVVLEEEEYRGSTVSFCPSCQGLWLDSDDFAFLSSQRDVFADTTLPRAYQPPPVTPEKGYLRCVRCGDVMLRKNYQKISGVLIDCCGDHGVWLDAGELEQIRTFIANDGLSKSLRHELAAHAIAIDDLTAKTNDLRTLFRTLNKFNLKRMLVEGF